MPVRWFTYTLVASTWLTVLGAPAAAQTSHPSFTVAVTGRGPAVVLIPGLLSSGEVWDSTVARADKARHFIMLDDPAFLFSALDDFLAARRQSREH